MSVINNEMPLITVSRLNALVRDLLEENFMAVRVRGELSNFATPASGHWYFSLKDDRAQLRGVMFRTRNATVPFRPENGMDMICCGRISLYPQRGEVQLVVEDMEPCGVGGLQLAFEQLKEKLADEGLFDPERKRSLPVFPETIGVITSASGAALQDILQVLRRRGFGGRVVLQPVTVQGDGAAGEIAAAIRQMNAREDIDVLIVGRGGGSMEDLWAFNEEAVARAISASRLPVIAAVGHETDFTIADFAADLRAPTPSAAAEIVARSRLELETHLDQLLMRLIRPLQHILVRRREHLDSLAKRCRQPELDLRLRREQLQGVRLRLQDNVRRRLEGEATRLRELNGQLDRLSPLATLERGYALVTTAGGVPVRSAGVLSVDEPVRIRFSRGNVLAAIRKVEP